MERDKNSVGERLKEVMYTRNLRQRDIMALTMPYQESLGITMGKTHLSNYINGRSNPDKNKLKLLATALEVSEPWLLGYATETKNEPTVELEKDERELLEMYQELTTLRKAKIHTFVLGEVKEQRRIIELEKVQKERKRGKKQVERGLVFDKSTGITIYPDVIGAAAGVGTSHYADFDTDEIMIPDEEVYEDTAVVPMYVRGDSMEPKYYNGDIIWVDTHNRSIDVHQVGVFDTEDGRVVKKMGYGELVSINREYPDIKLHEFMDFSTFGKVIDVIRSEQVNIWRSGKWV